jgi:hypothetical protein
MQTCPFCNYENPSAVERCEKCGAWFSSTGEKTSPPSRPAGVVGARSDFPPADTLEGRVLRLVQQGQKIPAIKLYREETGAGLKEAKESVEALGRQYGLNVGGSGCAGAALVACSLLMVIACGVLVSIFGW